MDHSTTPAAVDQATATEDEAARQDFAVFLLQLDKGATNHELTERLAELTRAMHDTGKGGSLTLKLTVTPQKDMQGVAGIGVDVAVKLPKLARPKVMRFITEDGELTTEHPAQRALLRRDELGAR